MTAVKVSHQASLMMSLRVIGPWSELMIYVPDQLAENAKYCRIWSYLLLEMWKVQCTYLSLSILGIKLHSQLLWS